MTQYAKILFGILLMVETLIFMGCGGGGGVKHLKSDKSLEPQSDKANVITSNEAVGMTDSSRNMERVSAKSKSIEPPKSIQYTGFNSTEVDEYNVYKKVLTFIDPKTGAKIKTIDLVKENPFHKMGLERRKEPYHNSTYYLMMPKAKTKYDIKKFLPTGIFKEIPEDFPVDRAISWIHVSMADNKYVAVSYEVEWLPNAYSDEGEWDGPGYGVHYVVVFNSLGNKIFTKQFDGITRSSSSVSHDGKYLFNMSAISPEWDPNNKYKFSVININENKIAYTELIENCTKLGGGGGASYFENHQDNFYFIKVGENKVRQFVYIMGKFYRQKEFSGDDFYLDFKNLVFEETKLNDQEEIFKHKGVIFEEIKLK